MIREARKEEALVPAQMARKIWGNDSVEEFKKEFEEFAENQNMVSFIIYEDSNPIGFANLSIRYDYVEGCETTPVAYLEGIYVDEKYRNRGYGRDLVKACENWAKDRDIKEFASDCELTNLSSFAFHKAIGFEEANRIICFKKDL
ncbi:aminoglycoside 6'-N-acetyltransferase [Anaerococcus sp. Marseille-Q7828]|uniref:aminoglycoside 6'-N-acetyltransferase n=1 Tax=Anaerococcus sp. Marseille-Q7828 TaxID=3036300 RepID=UPI0024ACB2A4|nr:aminoglycoside 6'-N-acetyltransferase [Anaerococcus sp. Marseille-Q7828]